jgi:hypothetical protein
MEGVKTSIALFGGHKWLLILLARSAIEFVEGLISGDQGDPFHGVQLGPDP